MITQLKQGCGALISTEPSSGGGIAAEQFALKLVGGQLTRMNSIRRSSSQPATASPILGSSVPPKLARILAVTCGPGVGFWELTSQFCADVDLYEVEHYRFAKWIERALAQVASSDSALAELASYMHSQKAVEDSLSSFPRQEICLDISAPSGGNFRLLCQPDPPSSPRMEGLAPAGTELATTESPSPVASESYDLGVLVLRRDSTAEWTRDLLQRFAMAIDSQGVLVVVTDHHDDHWIGDHLRAMSKQVRRERLGGDDPACGATGYVVQRNTMRVKMKNFDDEFAFRDSGRLIPVVSRPGVFSHRKLDLGARRLIDAMEILPQQRVLDIGCGSGVVGVAAALRQPTAMVTAIDSHARAIQCTRATAKLNRVEDRLEAHLTSDGRIAKPGSYDVVLANAPYYAHMRIAELFLESARRALRPGGRIWAVGKQPDWYQVNAPRWFDRVSLAPQEGGYWILTGICPTANAD